MVNSNQNDLPITLRGAGWFLVIAGMAWLLYLGYGLLVSYLEWYPSSDISLAIGIWISMFTGPVALSAVVIGLVLLVVDKRRKRRERV